MKSQEDIRLECLRIANGDLEKAKAMYAFVTGITSLQELTGARVLSNQWANPKVS